MIRSSAPPTRTQWVHRSFVDDQDDDTIQNVHGSFTNIRTQGWQLTTRTQRVHRASRQLELRYDAERPPVFSLASRSTYGHGESVGSSDSYPTNVNTVILPVNRTTNVFTLTAAWRSYVLHAWLTTGPARRPELAADHVTWTRQSRYPVSCCDFKKTHVVKCFFMLLCAWRSVRQ